jgi:hypothetical protein
MANTLTGIIPTIYEALDVVSRELVGLVPAVWRNPEGKNLQRAALNQSITFPITPASTSADNTPGVNVPDTGDQAIGNGTVTISKSKHVPIRWNGEEQQSLTNGDTPRLNKLLQDQFEQAFRTLTNEIEADIAAEYIRASRAAGTAGTTPFASSLNDAAQIRKILDDNGAPTGDRSIIVDTAAGANMRGLTQLTNVNEAGTSGTLRQGSLGNLFGMAIGESAQIATHTAGTAASATTDATGYAIGTKTITLASAGTGTIVAGDVITFAGDDNQYVVLTGDTDVSNGGTIVLAENGLRKAIPASATAITVEKDATSLDYVANLGFSKNAITLITRLPAMPAGGDIATDRQTVVDSRSGIAYEIAVYPGFHQTTYHVSAAWGQKIVKPEHCAILLG